MCLIAWNWQPGSATPLLLLANRDEFFVRPSLPAHWWPDSNHSHGASGVSASARATVLAGQDLQAGGTWLGVNRRGQLAAITNFRLPVLSDAVRPSRGELVASFLRGHHTALDFLRQLVHRSDAYNPFNLLLFDGQHLLGYESRHRRILNMAAGLGAVSNADFHTPWPKLVKIRQRLDVLAAPAGQALTADETAALFALLQDSTVAADHDLPHTGVDISLERALSAIHVRHSEYGTRASTVVVLRQSQVQFAEQCYDAQGPTQRHTFRFVADTI